MAAEQAAHLAEGKKLVVVPGCHECAAAFFRISAGMGRHAFKINIKFGRRQIAVRADGNLMQRDA